MVLLALHQPPLRLVMVMAQAFLLILTTWAMTYPFDRYLAEIP